MHLGSLYTAAGAYLAARARGGRFLVRIEDLDRPRVMPGAADRMLATLEAFGFEWDGPVARQSERGPLYAAALEELAAAGRLYACDCSRSRLAAPGAYPGTCRDRTHPPPEPCAWRVRADAGKIVVADRIQGEHVGDLADCGDFIVRRRDGIVAYVLAVVVDDAAQGVTDVVRGADLLDSTPRQIHLQTLLSLPTPGYAHLPVLTEPHGTKLAKSRRSIGLVPGRATQELSRVFGLLGLEPPPGLAGGTLREAWNWAIARWDETRVPRSPELAVEPDPGAVPRTGPL